MIDNNNKVIINFTIINAELLTVLILDVRSSSPILYGGGVFIFLYGIHCLQGVSLTRALDVGATWSGG